MESNQLETIKINGEVVHFDLNDLLDILPTTNDKFYNLIFPDGEIWWNIKLYKKTYNKFLKIKKARGQTDEL